MPGLFMFGSATLLQGPEPVVHVLADLVLGKAVALLQLAFELLAAALDDVEIVIGELAPLLLGRAFELLPIAFNPVPVHRHVPRCRDDNQRVKSSGVPRDRCGIVTAGYTAAFASLRRAVRMYSV